jgi:hypothetical protein
MVPKRTSGARSRLLRSGDARIRGLLERPEVGAKLCDEEPSDHDGASIEGRKMSRGAAKRHFSREDLAKQTAGVECRKDQGVLDEIPGAYKSIEAVMKSQKDLVEIVAEIKQVINAETPVPIQYDAPNPFTLL